MKEPDDHNGIDLIDLFKILWNKIFFISSIVLISAIFSFLYAFSQVNYYKSEALLEVVGAGGESSSAGVLGGYASIVGVDLGIGSSDQSSLIVETIKSKDFFKKLLKNKEVLPSIMASKKYDRETQSLIYNEAIYNSMEKTWFPEKKPSFLRAYKSYKGKLRIELNKNSGFLSIAFEHVSPVFAKRIINIIVEEINTSFRKKYSEESSRAIEFLEERLATAKILEMKQSVSQLIPAQIEAQMKADMKKNYALSYIDSPYISEDKSRPNKPLISILGTLVGFFLSILIVLIRHYLEERR